MLDPARSVMSLSIADIYVADRVGFYNEPHAMQLGASIAAEGQHDPIHVQRRGNAAKQPWMLVAGLHRLKGVELAGLPTVRAIQVADSSAQIDDLRRLELSENLDHRHRRPIERSMFIAERARLEEAVDHPGRVGEASQVRAGRARHSAAIGVMGAGWRARAAAACHLSIPALERYERLHREIVTALDNRGLVQRLNDHPLGESMTAMLRLVQYTLPAGDARAGDPYRLRRKIVEAIVADDAIPSVDEAYARVTGGTRKGDRASFDDDRGAELIGRTWQRLGPDGRRAALAALVEGADAATLRTMRALLDAVPAGASRA